MNDEEIILSRRIEHISSRRLCNLLDTKSKWILNKPLIIGEMAFISPQFGGIMPKLVVQADSPFHSHRAGGKDYVFNADGRYGTTNRDEIKILKKACKSCSAIHVLEYSNTKADKEAEKLEALRVHAKDLGIACWHNGKKETLEKKIKKVEDDLLEEAKKK